MNQLLAPAAMLVLWSLVMMGWMMVTRFGGFKTAGINLAKAPPGGRGVDLEGRLPGEVMWKSHNYVHLMEQPTIFYAAVIILALAGFTALDVALAWGYTLLRIVHSIWQATVNRIPVRFAFFAAASLCLLVLALRAVLVTLTGV